MPANFSMNAKAAVFYSGQRQEIAAFFAHMATRHAHRFRKPRNRGARLDAVQVIRLKGSRNSLKKATIAAYSSSVREAASEH
jgi:hypothetical protein